MSLSAFTRLASPQWLNNLYCTTPADVMYVFDVTDPTAFYPTENETWPAILMMVGPSSPLYGDYACGNLNVFPMDGDCCLSSVVKGYPVEPLAGSGDYASGSVNLDMGLDSFPKSSNGQKYCSLNATTRLEPSIYDSNLFGWARIYYLAQKSSGKGVCIDGQAKCFDNGTLFVYPEDKCNGSPSTIQLTTSIQAYSDPIAGDVTGQLFTVNEGKTKYFWTTMQPPWFRVSVPSAGFWQALEVAEFMVGIGSYLYLAWWTIQNLRQRVTLTGGLLMGSTILSIFFVSINCYINYNIIVDGVTANNVYNVMYYTAGLNSLLSIWYTTTFICVLNEIRKPWNYMIFFLVFVLHFVLDGSIYLQFLWNMTDDPAIRNGFFNHTALSNWSKLSKYYGIFISIYNTVPAPLIYYKLGMNRTNSLYQSFYFIYENDKWFYPCLLVRVVFLGLSYAVQDVIDSTSFLGSDTNVSSFSSVGFVIGCVFLFTQVYMLESVKRCMAKPSTFALTTIKSSDGTKQSQIASKGQKGTASMMTTGTNSTADSIR